MLQKTFSKEISRYFQDVLLCDWPGIFCPVFKFQLLNIKPLYFTPTTLSFLVKSIINVEDDAYANCWTSLAPREMCEDRHCFLKIVFSESSPIIQQQGEVKTYLTKSGF